MNIYSKNYRQNLIDYWRQWYPEWEIPKGYHVHHIKPKSTFTNKNDPKIHHPSNLIALHPDDHISIHKNRGDYYANQFFYMNRTGITPSNETRKKISEAQKGKRHSIKSRLKRSKSLKGHSVSSETRKKISKSHQGKVCSPEHRKKMSERQKGKPSHGMSIKTICRISDRKEFSPASWGRYMR